MRRLMRWPIVLGGVVLLGFTASVVLLQQNLTTSMILGEDPAVIDVASGTSLQGVAALLAEQGVLRHKRSFTLYGRFTGRAARIQAGEYEIQPGTTPLGFLDQLVKGQVKLHALTVIEGWSLNDLLGALRRHPAVAQTIETADPVTLAEMLGLEVEHAEGQFFPDTYRFPRDTSDLEILRQANDLLREHLDEAWKTRRSGLPVDAAYDLLILASIVERETALDEETPLVAGVFVRRLEKQMRLQADPTVIYGLGQNFNGNLTRQHLETDTPYNTYTRLGLPPTPIGLPGEQSLRAAANPDQGTALYFVATGNDDGSHFFTSTLEEHNVAVAKYLTRLRTRKE
ncbi:MAG: endolytic transglycosylase MltG [Pseudomonadota bacterium]|nr:endolytic transglycosylase MltG [Pseudomonadota bacterium]